MDFIVGSRSSIEWTRGLDGTPGSTWNPVTGCTKVSAGCDNCYAETFAERFRGTPGHYFEHGFDVQLREDKLGLPLRWKKPRRVFVNSMSDLFHDNVPDDYIARVWQAMGCAPQHTYQILTKRHARMRSWVTSWYSGDIPEPYEVRPIKGYPGYSVSTLGEVFGKRSDTRRNGMKFDAGEQGHLRVAMHRLGSPRSGERELVHRLVLSTFARSALPGEQACHRNGDPADNRLSNLYWGSQSDNWRDRISHGNGRAWSKLSDEDVREIRRRAESGESAYSIAREYPVTDTQIRNVLNGAQWSEPTLAEPRVFPERSILQSVWLGVSTENQRWADIRIPALLDTPAAVRFISAEPLLGPIDLHPYWLHGRPTWGEPTPTPAGPGAGGNIDMRPIELAPALHWVIVGGESGPGARPMHPDWARSLRDQCREAGVPFLFKQWGEWGPAPWRLERLAGEFTLDFKARSEAACATHALNGETFRALPHAPWSAERSAQPAGWDGVRRWGKKRSGRQLDGVVWDEFPNSEEGVLA